ncbi:MAG: helix-turn-helix domain-containing protein [Jatrophihabitantaceae bacterium]
MRRSSLTQLQAKQLAAILTARRTALGLSMRQVATRSGLHVSNIAIVEAGTNLSPQPNTLKAIARVLHLSVSDLYVLADWLPAGELPTLKPYLRAKYRDLDEQAIGEIEALARERAQRHGGTGPIDREDEQP